MKPDWCSVDVFSLGRKSWVPYLSVTSTLCRFGDTAAVWAMAMLEQLLWMVHALTGRAWPWEFIWPFTVSAFLHRKSPQLLPILDLLLLCTRPRQQALWTT